MGIGDNIRRSAEDALRDLAGLSEPTDDAHAPEPGDPDEGIKVHSSISEGSNAGDVRDGNLCFVNFKSAISALRIRPPRHVSRPFQQLAIS